MTSLFLCTLTIAALSSTLGFSVSNDLRISESLRTWREGRGVKRQNPECDTCDLQAVTYQLARQLDQQHLFVAERIRSDGCSGLKQSRLVKKGSKTYHSNSFTGERVAAIHEHSNNIRTVGLGEFVAVLNGVEFRTRHNDYPLRSPHRTEGGYEMTEEIPYPAVPPEVTNLENVADQIVEMREWFKAWRDQDDSVRDYKQYFKPLLCYLEGAWTLPEGDAVEEGFQSDRHIIEASSWFDLQEKIKFTSYAGKKDKDENYAFLPTTIVKVENNTSLSIVMAQWNYRILCHQLSRDLPTNRLRAIDDLQSRMAQTLSLEDHAMSRGARFQINPEDTDTWIDRIKVYQLLDELMEEIPGKDNYIGDLVDDAFGYKAKKLGSSEVLNAAYYSGWFSGAKDAMGTSQQHRGFADETIYMALTSHEKVVPLSVERCIKKSGKTTCTTYTQRWTYAIPLEIVYTTPLYNWNPYNLLYKGWSGSQLGLTVTEGGSRNGGSSTDKAFNGTNTQRFYQTPADFFTDDNGVGDSADTAAGVVSVLDPAGNMHSVIASGTRIMLPEIPGVGVLRTRYPIMPIHQEGSATWKEIDALKELALKPVTYKRQHYYFETEEPAGVSQPLKTSPTSVNDRTHLHYVMLGKEHVNQLQASTDANVTLPTSKDPMDHHYHMLTISRDPAGFYKYSDCDGRWNCEDGHSQRLYCTPNKDCVL